MLTFLDYGDILNKSLSEGAEYHNSESKKIKKVFKKVLTSGIKRDIIDKLSQESGKAKSKA